MGCGVLLQTEKDGLDQVIVLTRQDWTVTVTPFDASSAMVSPAVLCQCRANVRTLASMKASRPSVVQTTL